MVVIDTLIQRKEVVSKTENREVKHPQKKYFDTKKTSCLKNSLSKSKVVFKIMKKFTKNNQEIN